MSIDWTLVLQSFPVSVSVVDLGMSLSLSLEPVSRGPGPLVWLYADGTPMLYADGTEMTYA